jgi:hypothetical protein
LTVLTPAIGASSGAKPHPKAGEDFVLY